MVSMHLDRSFWVDSGDMIIWDGLPVMRAHLIGDWTRGVGQRVYQ